MRKGLILITLLIAFTDLKAQFSDIQLRDLNNNLVSIRDLKGEKLTIVDFWATWCKPCINSIPVLVNLCAKYSKEGVRFIGVNIEPAESYSTVRNFAVMARMNYVILLDINKDVMQYYGLSDFPVLIILDANGNFVYTHEGYAAGYEDDIEKQILSNLKSN